MSETDKPVVRTGSGEHGSVSASGIEGSGRALEIRVRALESVLFTLILCKFGKSLLPVLKKMRIGSWENISEQLDELSSEELVTFRQLRDGFLERCIKLLEGNGSDC